MAEYAQEPFAARLTDAWGHLATEILSVTIVAAIIIGLHPMPGMLMLTTPVALMGLAVMTWLLMRRHDRRLCEQCAAAMPLNAAEKAVRYRYRFALAHHGGDPRFLVPYFAVLIGSNFIPGTSGRLIWALVQTSMIYLIVSSTTHRRFQPWCPVCSEGGGGSERERDVTPPPSPTDRRQLV